MNKFIYHQNVLRMTKHENSALVHLSNEIKREQVKYEEAVQKDENLEVKKAIRLRIKILQEQLDEIRKKDNQSAPN